MSFLIAVNTCMSYWLSILDSQYKLKLEWEILRLSKNGSCMHITATSSPSPTSSAEIVHSYSLPQFGCMTNINNLGYSLGLQEPHPGSYLPYTRGLALGLKSNFPPTLYIYLAASWDLFPPCILELTLLCALYWLLQD